MSSLLDDWCLIANTITVDFSKKPSRFFGADFRLKWDQFEAQIKGVVDGRETEKTNK